MDMEEQPPQPADLAAEEVKEQAEATQGHGKKKKRKIRPYHRIHAHRNPLSDANFEYPVDPTAMDWSPLYPAFYKDLAPGATAPAPTIADVGCGYGGLLVSLSPLFPEKLMIGMEIRTKVVQYVRQRVDELRERNAAASPGAYQNISALETNAMKYLPNFFAKGQLEKIFFLYPDPHFQKSKYRRRIINLPLLADYAYVLKEGGIAYTCTDVKDLHDWMVSHFSAHPAFERIPDEEAMQDPVTPFVMGGTEEGKKVERAQGAKYLAVFRRLPFPK